MIAFCLFFNTEGEAQGRVADQECGVGFLQHLGEIGLGFREFRRNAPPFAAKDADQSLRAAGTAVQCDAGDTADRLGGNEKQAANGGLGSDGKARKNDQIRDARVFNGRDNGDVRSVGAKSFSTLRGNGEGKLIFAAQRAVGEASDEWGGVEILNDGDAERIHGQLTQLGPFQYSKGTGNRRLDAQLKEFQQFKRDEKGGLGP